MTDSLIPTDDVASNVHLVLQALRGQISSFSYFRGENSRLDVLLANVSEILSNHRVHGPLLTSEIDATRSNSTGQNESGLAVVNIENFSAAIKEIKLQLLAFGVFARGCSRLKLFIEITDLILTKMTDTTSTSACIKNSILLSSENVTNNDCTLNRNDRGNGFNLENDENCSNNNSTTSSPKQMKFELKTKSKLGNTIEGIILQKNSSDKKFGSGSEYAEAIATATNVYEACRQNLSAIVSQVNSEIENLISVHSATPRSSSSLPYAKIRFRRIRVGSYELSKVVPSNSTLDLEASATYLCDKGMLFSMYHSSSSNRLVRIIIPHNTIRTVQIRVGSSDVTLQIRTGSKIATMIREKLGMKLEHRESKGWYDPAGCPSERIIWFIGKPLSKEHLDLIENIYSKKVTIINVSSSTIH